MKRMTSKERVHAAIARRPVDRLPLMLWFEPQLLLKLSQGFERPRGIVDRLRLDGMEALRKAAPTEALGNAAALMAYTMQSDYLRQLGSDMVEFHWFFTPLILKDVRIRDGNVVATDRYGIRRSVMGLYLESVGHPCETIEDLDRYEFPDLSHPIFYEHIRLYRMLHPDVSIIEWVPGVQDTAQHFMGMEKLYTWMAEYPEAIERFFRRLGEHSLEVIRGAVRAGADVIEIMDDYGTQDRLMISRRMWDRFTLPNLRKQVAEIHRLGAIALLHSCGHVEPLLDGIADAGVDLLHPFQPSAGNDLRRAKAEFGDRLAFMTGIDAQRMSRMSPDEVRETTLKNGRIGMEGGGFILCTSHYLQEDVPIENIKAMFVAIRELGSGK